MSLREARLFKVAVSCVVYRPASAGQREYLLIKRADDNNYYPGRWCLPGGIFEELDYYNAPLGPDQTYIDPLRYAISREVSQEVGLDIGSAIYLENAVFIDPHGTPVLLQVFYACGNGEVILERDKFSEFKWVRFGLGTGSPTILQSLNPLGIAARNIMDAEKRLQVSAAHKIR